nr:capsid protein [Picobirnavirus sp.]
MKDKKQYRDGAKFTKKYDKGFASGICDNPLAEKGNEKMYPKYSSHGQDPSWYASNDQMLRDMATFSFSLPIGARINPIEAGATVASPGIMAIRYLPSLGLQNKTNSALARAAQQFYTYVQQHYTAVNSSYESADLLAYMLAVSNICTWITIGKRAYGCMKKFSHYNKYLAKSLVNACGFNYEDLKGGQADFRTNLNTYIEEIRRSFNIPADLNWTKRSQFISKNVFTDGLGKKFQMYVFQPTHYFIFDPTATAGSALALRVVGTQYMTRDSYFSVLETMVGALRADTDVARMSGDILRAYGQASVLQFELLDENYETDILYSQEMVDQLHNADLIAADVFSPVPSAPQVDTVYFQTSTTSGVLPSSINPNQQYLMCQENGVPISIPVVYQSTTTVGTSQTQANTFTNQGHVLDLDYENPGPGEIIDGSRLMFEYSQIYSSSTGYRTVGIAAGCELLIRAEIYAMSTNGEVFITNVKGTDQFYSVPAPTDSPATTQAVILTQVWSKICPVTRFKNHFKMLFLNSSGPQNAIWDTHNFSDISGDVVRMWNDKIWYTLFNINESLNAR